MISSIRIQNFRGYTDSFFELQDGVTIIVGPNASGKTTLLEALYVLAQGESYKAQDFDLVRFDSDWARLDANFLGGDRRTIKLQKTNTDNVVKTFSINEDPAKRLKEHQLLPVVLFEPMDMNILTGDPSLRRAFVDVLLGGLLPDYNKHLKNYRRALMQRNTLLKKMQTSRKDELFVWNLRLSELGGVIHSARQKLVERCQEGLQKEYAYVSGKDENVRITYISDATGSDYAESMLARLEANLNKDIMRGFTSTGPHRDDLLLTIHDHDAKDAASRGETRSLILSLKLVQLRLLEEARGVKPLILLDDVFSELDGHRRKSLAAALQSYQTIITTTDADVVVEHFMNDAHVIPLSVAN